MKKKILFILLACILIIVIYFLFFKKDAQGEIKVQELGKSNIEEVIQAVGEVYAKEQVDVGAQVSGQIIKLYVDIGDKVKQGDLIAQIDKDKQQNELDITKAQLESAKANLESKKVAFEIATKQYEREKKLFVAKATSLESLETLKNSYYELKANVAELNAQVVQYEITLKNAQKDLGYTTITAPIDGVIINVAVDEGQTVNASQNTPTIVRIANLDIMEVKMEIAEADVGKIKIGDVVNFSLLSDPDTKYEANIASIDPANTEVSDSTSSTSSSSSSSSSSSTAIYYYANFFVQNNDNFLRIGMSLENEIVVNSVKDILAVPTYLIKNDRGGYYVDILENGVRTKKYVTLGAKDSLNTQILEGLNEGDKLIMSLDVSVSKPRVR
ncbi:efflux RND transporter periplasmic adaptor subunit [Campylobacter sp. LR264d]|uniref:efflux RND transporter periplasmic adaptor subunit n=1 Tax=unclassified Campylobacter TaxID=2593542 RepID=UPI001237D10A|nr:MULTISPECIES: efflux RND transporter periplasmic adaptor subunit [unclassified Campylobacter]KAA6224692.1 efflux RND transporter periplasmic adaptor subunit [Campylobacter sp. LR185c]KAA6230091.1 efflux RND transporter periplasmic adaptor subunit [Campylobacter sp. LR264d]KAA8603966.1 efflux transporter periplasmic adaptor subunit [Campylobacter sp. LR185c]